MKKLFKNIPVLQGKRVILRGLTDAEADDLGALTEAASVYEYLPTFLFEQKYSDPHTVIQRLYDECLNDSLILGIFLGDQFCGLAEMYGYRKPIKKNQCGLPPLGGILGTGTCYRNAWRHG